MAHSTKKTEPTMTGSTSVNLRGGARSEYLAQFVFSSFGTAIPVPRQEDTGLDIYCTLLEPVGRRAWPRSYYSVQVKSNLEPWVFDGAESVRWIIEHPLPIFLSVVLKSEARILVYHTTPRFSAWALPTHPNRLELILGTETKAQTVDWNWSAESNTFNLRAPILNFTIQELLNDDFRARIADVLKFWIDYDVGNLARIRNGMPTFWVPCDYETNQIKFSGWMQQGGPFRDDLLQLARNRAKELLGLLATHYFKEKDLVSATIYAMALRRLSPEGHSEPRGPDDPGGYHNRELHAALNRLFGIEPGGYAFQACESLLRMLKDELAKHGIADDE
jgi:hypothetical protein